MIDADSEPGAWAKALPFCRNITITEHPGVDDPLPPPGHCGTAEINPLAVPPFSDDHL
jgi:hypothetical protein